MMFRQNLHYLLLISISALAVGSIFYGIYNNFIIIQFPIKKLPLILQNFNAQKKNITLALFKKGSWHFEDKELLFSNNIVKTMTYLVSSWLTLLAEEEVMDKKVTLQAVLIDAPTKEVSLSFDRNPFSRNASTFQKVMWVEALLKTILLSGLQVQSVRFLVNHKPLADAHVDFSCPWPITGYLSVQK
jgi:hypothetical protein